MSSKKSDLARFEALANRIKTHSQCTEKQAREFLKQQLTKSDSEKRG